MSSLRKLMPLADRVLVKRLLPKAQTAGGIYLPDSKASKTNDAEVVAVGPGRTLESGKLQPMSVAVGDKVLLPDYAGQSMKEGEDEYTLLRDEDILAKYQS